MPALSSTSVPIVKLGVSAYREIIKQTLLKHGNKHSKSHQTAAEKGHQATSTDPKGALVRMIEQFKGPFKGRGFFRKANAGPQAIQDRGQGQDGPSGREAITEEYFKEVTESNPFLRIVLIQAVARFCQLFARYATASVDLDGIEILHRAILNREKGQALITVSNHVAAIDDPFVVSNIAPKECMYSPEYARWTMCATDRCFKSKLAAQLSKAVQVIPVERGAGLYQPGMKVASELLKRGAWVHIFPEGTRSTNGELLKMRPGVGQLVADSVAGRANQAEGVIPPMIVPFFHSGMASIMPKGSALPKSGANFKVWVGEPIQIDDVVNQFLNKEISEYDLRSRVIERVEDSLVQLQQKGLSQDRVKMDVWQDSANGDFPDMLERKEVLWDSFRASAEKYPSTSIGTRMWQSTFCA